jgi:hypothetical protein
MPRDVHPRRVKRHAVTQPSDPSYRFIPLTQGQNAIVDTGDFEWLSKWNWFAWWSADTKSFYAMRHPTKSDQLQMHNVILGIQPGERGDHINRNTLDNRRNNLRKATHGQNQHNQRKRCNNSSGYIGVSWDKRKNKWRAYVSLNRKQTFLGYFDSAEQAAHARDDAATKMHGQFASLNFQ